ncbi:NtaA/DmoA family FMN-dependent monooxygenase [Microbacterium sp.]|uniref:NtaA/DmoA family FMN-dependent monooxygenase n=1 Tax=Microbacterium sp. TaxID=51671 RepID=UPI003A85908F
MALTTFMLPAGYHKDSWRRPDSRAEELGKLGFLAELVKMAEDAKFDAVFFGDISHANTILRGDIKMNGLYEPIATLGALSALTSRIGLVGTMSTSFGHPYNVARQIAAVDHLSDGRAGWNIVTSSDGHKNFGAEATPNPTVRYRRATEFVEAVVALWDSWEDGAVIVDRESGWWADTSKIHRIDHHGDYFQIEGPMTFPRSPQGRPVMAQAGSSGPGVELGTAFGDIIYTAQPLLDRSIDFYARFKDLAVKKGRAAHEVKILPGIMPILGNTQAEANELADELAGFVHLENGREQLAASLSMDLSELDIDESIPAEWFSDDPSMGSRYDLYRLKSVDQGMTLKELIIDQARSTGHQWIAGTPSSVADIMVDWFEQYACDGFNVNAPYYPGGFQIICQTLVPELQDRGYFHADYLGPTLRDNLGLDRPAV